MPVSAERAVVGRYMLHELIGSGGMARVYVGRLEGWAGFSKAVAVKRLHPDLASDPELAAMLLDEARLTAHIRHPNVVGTVDVVREQGEFLLVMDYVVGVSLDVLMKRCRAAQRAIPDAIVAALTVGILRGLHAAHEACDATGRPLHIVHRDMSPPNVIVEESGLAKVLDFGIATASDRLTTTKEGTVKGKPGYIAPEQLTRSSVDRRADVFAVGVILWEMLTASRLRPDASFASVSGEIERGAVTASTAQLLPSAAAPELGAIAMRAMSVAAFERYATAEAMAEAIETVVAPAALSHVKAWCAAVAPEHLESSHRAAIQAASAKAPEGSAPAETIIERPGPAVPEPDSAPARRSGIARRAAFIVPVAALLGAAIHLRARPETNDQAHVEPSTPEASSLPPTPPALSSAVATAEPTATTALPAPPWARPPGSAHPERPPARVSDSSRSRAPKAAVTGPCRIPFTLDANGVKIPKRECL